MSQHVQSSRDDFSSSFGVVRGEIRNSQGVTLIDFKKTLTPHYWIALRDIGVGYLALAVSVVFAVWLERIEVPIVVVAILVGVMVGYWIAYLQLFIHEGAHWNLATDHARSDLICNLLVSWWAGLEVNAYRKTHFQHHRSLGKTDDSERTYFQSLNFLFLLKGLSGIQAFSVILMRKHVAEKKKAVQQGSDRRRMQLIAIGSGFIAHASIVCALLCLGLWGVAIGWILGVGSFFPLFGALRQLLEHRSDTASPIVDYSKEDHGSFARVFDGGFIAKTFGGAGFNRHLLHHWEPTVSYTRLGDLERFLLDTPMKSIIESRRTTYGLAFWRLFRAG